MLIFKSGVWGGIFPFWFIISNCWKLMLWRCCFSSRKTLAVWNSCLCPAGCLTSCSLIPTAVNLHIKERLYCALLGQFTPSWQNNHLCICNVIPALPNLDDKPESEKCTGTCNSQAVTILKLKSELKPSLIYKGKFFTLMTQMQLLVLEKRITWGKFAFKDIISCGIMYYFVVS